MNAEAGSALAVAGRVYVENDSGINVGSVRGDYERRFGELFCAGDEFIDDGC